MLCPNCNSEYIVGQKFCADCGAATSASRVTPISYDKEQLRQNVEDVVKEKLKDQHFVEMEVAENIAKRLGDWAKLFGMFVALPLGLLAIVLATLGITTYQEFLKEVHGARDSVTASLTTSKEDAQKVSEEIKRLKQRTADLNSQANEIDSLNKRMAHIVSSVNDISLRETPSTDVSKLIGEQKRPLGVAISHHNQNVDMAKLQQNGISFVFMKATQGLMNVDPAFDQYWKASKAMGLVRGAYHIGTSGDGTAQAKTFLSTVHPEPSDMLALDFEANPTGPSMSLAEAKTFVLEIFRQTKRYPIFYSGHDIKAELGQGEDKILASCPFWLAQYGPTPVVPPNWRRWTFWQYTDGALGPEPRGVPGVGLFYMNIFNGTVDELRSFAMTPRLPP